MRNNCYLDLKDALYDFKIENLRSNIIKINAYFNNELNAIDTILFIEFKKNIIKDKSLLINSINKLNRTLKNNINKLKINKLKNKKIIITNRNYESKLYKSGKFVYLYTLMDNKNLIIQAEIIKSDNKLNNSIFKAYKELLSKYLRQVIEANRDKRKIQEALLLIESSKILNSTLRLNNLLSQIMGEARKIMNTEGVSLLLINKNTGELIFHTVTGKKSSKIKSIKIPSGKGIAGWIVDNKKSLIVNDVRKDKRFYQGTDKKTGFKTYNLIGAPLMSNDKVIGAIEAVNKKGHIPFEQDDMDVFVALANMAAIAIQNAQYYKELHQLFLNTVKTIVNAIEAKDKYTRGHSERVTKYSVMLARYLKLNEYTIERIQLAALLHDVGKIGIDENILGKPGKLTDKEYKEIQKHPGIGESIIKPIISLKDIVPGIRNHHERWDGHGYPDNLKENKIPLMGRIIALADTYDAMTSDRPYRKGLPHKTAIKEIKECSGTQFDPELAKAFINMFRKNELLDEKIMSVI